MFFPKKGELWTYKERARFFAVAGSLPLVIFLVLGIFFAAMPIILVSVLGLVGAGMFWISAERKFRNEP
ncbi:hypothetical protein [Arthrobacter sedimenti]|uniref:Uncharacterized protein n=1 Tax=Arthrobacter sedimenti TaxID=2694931 RepID=A0ABV8WQQ9_9MICC